MIRRAAYPCKEKLSNAGPVWSVDRTKGLTNETHWGLKHWKYLTYHLSTQMVACLRSTVCLLTGVWLWFSRLHILVNSWNWNWNEPMLMLPVIDASTAGVSDMTSAHNSWYRKSNHGKQLQVVVDLSYINLLKLVGIQRDVHARVFLFFVSSSLCRVAQAVC